MGTRGPIPARSGQRRRRNKPADGIAVTTGRGAAVVEKPEADPSWHPIAHDWFESLATSDGCRFYEPSDWQHARIWAEILSRQLKSGRPSGQIMASWTSASDRLLTTASARQRVLGAVW